MQKAMWYVIQTMTGKEEELAFLIQKKINKKWYDCCFVIQAEWMKRLGGCWQIQVRPLFPGYVLIDTERPEEVFLELKGIPRFARILGSGKGFFSPVEEEERRLLERLMNGQSDHRLRISLVETSAEGEIGEVYGPLKQFEGKIERLSLHKRFAVVRVNLAGRERTVRLGIGLGREYLIESAAEKNR